MRGVVGTAKTIPFIVFDIDGETPVTGLTNSAFAKALHVNGSVSGQTATVTEIGGGYYALAFTPNAAGQWLATVTDPSGAVNAWQLDVASDFVGDIVKVRKVTTNRQEIDFDTQTLVSYDDDGTTPYITWALDTDGGEDVAPFAGSQTKRGVPT